MTLKVVTPSQKDKIKKKIPKAQNMTLKAVTASQKDKTKKELLDPYIKDRIISIVMKNDKLEILASGFIAFLLHLSVLKGTDFVYDDRMVISSDDVLGLRPWKEMLTRDFWGNSMSNNESHKSYRPLTVLAFRLIHHMFGLQAYYFHLYNLVLHVLVCSCYAVLCRKIITFSATSTVSSIVDQDEIHNYGLYDLQKVQVWVASIFFAVHPIHTEAVASIVGISDIQCALFYILAILALLHSVGIDKNFLKNKRRRTMTQNVIRMKLPTYFLAVFLAFCSSLSKEVGVMTFGIFFIYELVLVMKLHHQTIYWQEPKVTMKKIIYNVYWKSPKNIFRITVSCFSPILITCAHISLHGEKKIYSWTVLENHISLIECKLTRVLSYMNIHIIYLWKLIFPFRLSYDYGWKCLDPVDSIIDNKNIFTALGYSFFIFLSMKSLLQKNIILFFSICLLAIPFLLASNLFFPVSMNTFS